MKPKARIPVVLSMLTFMGLQLPWLAEAYAAGTVTQEVRIKSAQVAGSEENTATVQKALRARKAALETCYGQNRAKFPGEVGRLDLSVRVAPGGQVTAIKVLKTSINAPLASCVSKAIKGWRFTPWKATVRQFASVDLLFQLSAKPPRGSLIKGGIPARLVAGTLTARLPKLFKECAPGATFKRRIRLHLMIDFNGLVTTSSVYGRVPSDAVRTCLATRMTQWDFPIPDNGHRTMVYFWVSARDLAGMTKPAGAP